MSINSTPTVSQKKAVCRAPVCQFEVRDTDNEELIRVILDHATQKHQITLPAERVRAAIEPAS